LPAAETGAGRDRIFKNLIRKAGNPNEEKEWPVDEGRVKKGRHWQIL
jgi:hypothetical protein